MKRFITYKQFLKLDLKNYCEILPGNKSRKKPNLLNIPICLDTETSHNHNENEPIGWIYQWAFTFGEICVFGRNPVELMNCMEYINEYLENIGNVNALVFVHNLSYDWSYLYKFIDIINGQLDILAVASHKIIQAKKGNIQFRCTYKLSNRSLDNWAKTLGCKARKKKGLIDYTIIRNQNDRLSFNDWKYQAYDVITLEECIYRQLDLFKDNLYTIPLTSTGYVRRECQRAFNKDKKGQLLFKNTRLGLDLYKALRSAFMGGYTHGNILYSGQTIKGNIRHRDFVSHYPSMLICKDFPIGRFLKVSQKNCTLEYIENSKEKNVFLMLVVFDNLRLKKDVTFPCLSYSKANKGRKKPQPIKAICDNGRIISTEKDNPFMIWCTDEDFFWYKKQYNGSFKIVKMYQSKKGKIPEYIINTVFQFLFNKTKFKELTKEDSENIEFKNELMKAKNLLNGLYGCLATDVVRDSYEQTITGKWILKEMHTDDQICESLDNYYNNRGHCMIYQFGVWCTSCARSTLLETIELIQKNGGIPLYCDTDSCFYVSNEDCEKALNEWNKTNYNIAKEKGFFIEYNGKEVILNQFEDEKEQITEFRFLHAKCYAYITSDNKLHCTIAGVSEFGRNGNTRIQELGSISELKTGKKFVDCGGTRSIYPLSQIATYNGNIYADSCIILDNEKTLKWNEIEVDFEEVMEYIK